MLDDLYRACYFGCFEGDLRVSLGTAFWYRSNYGTDFDNSEIASPALYGPLALRKGMVLAACNCSTQSNAGVWQHEPCPECLL